MLSISLCKAWLVTPPPPASTGPTATARGAAICSRAAASPRETRASRAAPTPAPPELRPVATWIIEYFI